MQSAADDVHHRQRQQRLASPAEVAPERHALRRPPRRARRRARPRGWRWRRGATCPACRRARCSVRSTAAQVAASRPTSVAAISSFDGRDRAADAAAAVALGSPSRRSTASWRPVEAPDGTLAARASRRRARARPRRSAARASRGSRARDARRSSALTARARRSSVAGRASGRRSRQERRSASARTRTRASSRGQVLDRRLAVDAGEQQAAELARRRAVGGGSRPRPPSVPRQEARAPRRRRPRRRRAAHALSTRCVSRKATSKAGSPQCATSKSSASTRSGIDEQVLRRPVAEDQRSGASRAGARPRASIARREVGVPRGGGAVVGVDAALHERRQVGEVARPPASPAARRWMSPSSAPARSRRAAGRSPRAAARPSSSRRPAARRLIANRNARRRARAPPAPMPRQDRPTSSSMQRAR